MAGRVRVTPSQEAVMRSAAGDEHELAQTDRRVVPALIRRGLVAAAEVKRGRRKPRTVYRLTTAGVAAVQAGLEVIVPPARPDWRGFWEREKVGTDHWLVEGHELHRPARTMLWQVRCPERRRPVAHRDTLAEAVEALYEHLGGVRGITGARPHCHPEPVDLDRLGPTEPGIPAAGASGIDVRPSLFDALGAADRIEGVALV